MDPVPVHPLDGQQEIVHRVRGLMTMANDLMLAYTQHLLRSPGAL
jgi:hypothetical protein